MNSSSAITHFLRRRLRLDGRRIVVSFFSFCLLLGLAKRTVRAEELRAGTAKIDITPTQPVTLAGYASRKDLSQGVHDPLSARAVAFEQDGRRLVLVSVDNLGFYSGTAESLRQAILAASAVQPSELFLCAIHTHSAPSLTLNAEKGHPNNVEYTKQLRDKLVEIVRSALERLAPVRIGIGSGSSPVGVNRRETVIDNTGKSRIVLGRNPSVVTDREVQVLKLTRADRNELSAVVFAYATHSTSLGPRNYMVSGDLHGLAEQFLEKYFGPNLVAPGFAGASGDIDPWVRVLPDFKTNNGWVPEPVLMGTMLGEETARVIEGITNSMATGPIRTIFKSLALPGQPRGEPATNTLVPFNLTLGRVGDIAFVGFGGEVFNEIGRTIKAASPFRCTFVFTHCNGTAGYLPARSSYPEGGYEVQSSSFAPGADAHLIAETVAGLRQLFRAAD